MTGLTYVPFEVVALMRRLSIGPIVALAANLGIVAYLAWALGHRQQAEASPATRGTLSLDEVGPGSRRLNSLLPAVHKIGSKMPWNMLKWSAQIVRQTPTTSQNKFANRSRAPRLESRSAKLRISHWRDGRATEWSNFNHFSEA